ncbi:MAG: shikimate dehydrogenase family protein [Vulcanimicrobiaceae bacterium]
MKLAVIGDPVDHSRSPAIHRAFLKEAEIEGSYVALRAPLPNVISVVRRMQMDDYTGCNVTYPLKEEAARACDVLSEEAERAGAVNTIFFGREIVGHNTDGIGARLALEALIDESISLLRIGILGYGATARAILAQFAQNDAYTFVWGRDSERIDDVCSRYDALPWPRKNPPEIVISTLPPGVRLPPEVLDSVISADIVMDANYGERATLSRQLDREVIPGDAMLEAQARASFDFWLAHIDGVAPGE